MLGKLAASIGRRGILRGGLGLAAAVGLGGSGVVGRAAAEGMTFGPPLAPLEFDVSRVSAYQPEAIEELKAAASAHADTEALRPRFDGLDVDIAVLRSPSPAWKLMAQRRREAERYAVGQSLWRRLQDRLEQWESSRK